MSERIQAIGPQLTTEQTNELRLWFAARDLLEACEAAVEGFRDTFERAGGAAHQKAYEADKMLRAAIAKAKGGAA